MRCLNCGEEMVQDAKYENYHICYHCGTQVSFNRFTGRVEWEFEMLKIVKIERR